MTVKTIDFPLVWRSQVSTVAVVVMYSEVILIRQALVDVSNDLFSHYGCQSYVEL